MAMTFSRANRTLTNDSFRLSAVGLVIIMAVLAAWGAWFMLARVPLYQVSTDAQVTRDEVIARFTPEQFARLRAGQSATVEFNGQSIDAQVMETASPTQNRMAPNTARLALYVGAPRMAALAKTTPTRVQVEVEVLAPYELAMRASGQMQ